MRHFKIRRTISYYKSYLLKNYEAHFFLKVYGIYLVIFVTYPLAPSGLLPFLKLFNYFVNVLCFGLIKLILIRAILFIFIFIATIGKYSLWILPNMFNKRSKILDRWKPCLQLNDTPTSNSIGSL